MQCFIGRLLSFGIPDAGGATELAARRLDLLTWMGRQRVTEGMRSLLKDLEDVTPESANGQLIVADCWRLAGEAEKAHAMERSLFERRALAAPRVARFLEALQEKEGRAAAMSALSAALDWTLHPELLDLGLQWASESEDEAFVERLKALRTANHRG